MDRGPTGVFDSLSCGNFDATEAVIEWESIFTGQSFETLVSADEPRMVADPGEGALDDLAPWTGGCRPGMKITV